LAKRFNSILLILFDTRVIHNEQHIITLAFIRANIANVLHNYILFFNKFIFKIQSNLTQVIAKLKKKLNSILIVNFQIIINT
jgi:hypothetical protein